MYDDYDVEQMFTQDHTYDLLDESYVVADITGDDEYARESQDFETLAYKHYA